MAKETFTGPDGTEWDITPNDNEPDGVIGENNQIHCKKCGGLWFNAQIVLDKDWDVLSIFTFSPDTDVITCRDCGEPLTSRQLRDFKVV